MKKDIYNYIITNQVLDKNQDTNRYYFADAVLFSKDNTLEKEVYNLLSDTLHSIDCGNSDTDYQILASALQYFDNEALDYDDVCNDNFEINFPFEGFSSIYTWNRLQYINIHNQAHITDAIKEELADDIQSAAAYWYDDQVQNTIYQLVEAFKDN